MRVPYRERIILSETEFIDIDIKETSEGIKFSLVLIRNNKRLVGFDNHEKHKPHKHVKNKVYDYDFIIKTIKERKNKWQ